jgi:bifunctional DNA-binding transcriptional regulator/antitoxin component of YhaV-PrlF toxin-antitoxin module
MQEISRVDEKGRLLIPLDIRRALGLEPGVEALVGVEGKRAIISPVFDKKIYDIRIIMGDAPGTLAKIAALLSKEGFDIIMSESRSLERERSAEWDLTGKYKGDLSSLVRKLKASGLAADAVVRK